MWTFFCYEHGQKLSLPQFSELQIREIVTKKAIYYYLQKR